MQDNQDKATSTDEVQTEYKRIKKTGGSEIFCTRLNQPGRPPSLQYNRHRFIPQGKTDEE